MCAMADQVQTLSDKSAAIDSNRSLIKQLRKPYLKSTLGNLRKPWLFHRKAARLLAEPLVGGMNAVQP